MRDWPYRFIVRIFRLIFFMLGLKIQIRGAENVPRHGAAVLAGNHISYLDFALNGLVASRRRRLVRFMAKTAVFANSVAGPMMRLMRHIPVDRAHGASAYRHAVRELSDGQIVGIFPEATIGRSWTLMPFKPGAAALAIQMQVPIIPVIGWGGHRVATVDGHRNFRRGTPITLIVGPPIYPGPDTGRDELTTQLWLQMQKMLDEAQQAYTVHPTSEDDRWWLPAHLGGTAPGPQFSPDVAAAKIRR